MAEVRRIVPLCKQVVDPSSDSADRAGRGVLRVNIRVVDHNTVPALRYYGRCVEAAASFSPGGICFL